MIEAWNWKTTSVQTAPVRFPSMVSYTSKVFCSDWIWDFRMMFKSIKKITIMDPRSNQRFNKQNLSISLIEFKILFFSSHTESNTSELSATGQCSGGVSHLLDVTLEDSVSGF